MAVDIKSAQEHHRYGIDPHINEALANALDDENDTAVLSIIKQLSVNDIVDFLTTATNEQRQRFIALNGNSLDPQVLLNMDESLLSPVLEMIGPHNAAKIINKLQYDDIATIMRAMDSELCEQIILALPGSVARMLHFVWSYPESSAGRLIQKNVVAIFHNWTLSKAIDFLSSHRGIAEELVQVFVVNDNGYPIGAIPIARIFLSPDTQINVTQIMDKNIKIIRPDMDQEEVAHVFRKYSLVSAPVVGDSGAMIGYIAAEDISKVMNNEIERDILQLGGISENDMHTNAIATAKSRFPWLFINIIMATITSSVIGVFEGTIGKVVILAALMPLIASTGGNAGIQSVTVVIRGLAKREITKINALRVICKEALSGLITGAAIALTACVVLIFLIDNKEVTAIFTFSVVTIFVFSSLLGAIVPLLLNFFDVDPAVASSIIVTTCTDIASYGLFLGLATIFLM